MGDVSPCVVTGSMTEGLTASATLHFQDARLHQGPLFNRRCNPVGGTREEASEAGPLPSIPPTHPALQPGLEPWYQQTNTLQGATPAWATVLDLVRHEAGPGAWDPSAQVPHEDAVDEDGYVMDVYAALPAAAEDEQEETDAAWEAHLAGRAPVVQASRVGAIGGHRGCILTQCPWAHACQQPDAHPAHRSWTMARGWSTSPRIATTPARTARTATPRATLRTTTQVGQQ